MKVRSGFVSNSSSSSFVVDFGKKINSFKEFVSMVSEEKLKKVCKENDLEDGILLGILWKDYLENKHYLEEDIKDVSTWKSNTNEKINLETSLLFETGECAIIAQESSYPLDDMMHTLRRYGVLENLFDNYNWAITGD